jgi:hypothetical protein
MQPRWVVIDETFGLRPDRIPATASSNFFPHLASSASSRKSKKRTNRRPPLCFSPSGAGRSPPVASTAIEAAITRARLQKDKDHVDYWYICEKQGWIHRAHYDRIFQHAGQTGPGSQRDSEKSPDFRVLTSTFEFGAAWKKISQNGRDYLSVRLDDPSFATPIFAKPWLRATTPTIYLGLVALAALRSPALLSTSTKVHANEQQHQH